MEIIVGTIIFILALKMLLGEEEKNMSKRGKRRGKRKTIDYVDDQETIKNMISSDKTKKPFEAIKLLPAREAQESKI